MKIIVILLSFFIISKDSAFALLFKKIELEIVLVGKENEIEKNLMLSSDHHRFFIFFSSTDKEYDAFELDDFQKLGYGCDISYSIEPLNYQTFQKNKLLVQLIHHK